MENIEQIYDNKKRDSVRRQQLYKYFPQYNTEIYYYGLFLTEYV